MPLNTRKPRCRMSACEKPHKIGLLLLGLALLAGCGTAPLSDSTVGAASGKVIPRTPAQPLPLTNLFGAPVGVPDFSDLVALSQTQEAEFLRYFNSDADKDEPPHLRVVAYLEARLGQARFQHTTMSASETLVAGSGNCMSLALATAALAHLGGVDVDWQITRSNPVYSAEGGLIYSANHIHTKLYDPGFEAQPNRMTLVRPHVLVDYFSNRVPLAGRTLDGNQVIGLVYQNLAAESLADGDLRSAFWLTRAGLENDPKNPDLFNTMGLLHRKAGAPGAAEDFFIYALDAFGDQLVILRNYQRLLIDSAREIEARGIERRILALPDPDPYPMLELGDEALLAGDPLHALDFYDRARRTAPYLHEVYWKIAKAQRQLGNTSATREAISMALERAASVSDLKKFKAGMQAAGGDSL